MVVQFLSVIESFYNSGSRIREIFPLNDSSHHRLLFSIRSSKSPQLIKCIGSLSVNREIPEK